MIFRENRFLEGMSIYRFLINIGVFILFVAVMTVIVYKHVSKRSFSLKLKKSVFILNEAMRYVTTQPFEEDDGNDIYYWYLSDALKRNLKSFECGKSNRHKNKACPEKEYYTMNGKATMSELIYKKGIDIVVDDKLFRVNTPVMKDDPLIVIMDINGGNTKPNRMGYDVFVFEMVNKEFVAMGMTGTLYPVTNYKFYCNPESISKDELLGVNCAYYALKDSKYFLNLKF